MHSVPAAWESQHLLTQSNGLAVKVLKLPVSVYTSVRESSQVEMGPRKRRCTGAKQNEDTELNSIVDVSGPDTVTYPVLQTGRRSRGAAQIIDNSTAEVPEAGLPERTMATAPVPPEHMANPTSQEMRSCENCRRGKLKCSRTFPCVKCVEKNTDCVYEQDKRRGPKPGYIEEIYRRVDALEQMVIGQSLLFRLPSNSAATSDQEKCDEDSSRFNHVLDDVRATLLRAGRHSPAPAGSVAAAAATDLADAASSMGAQSVRTRRRGSVPEQDLNEMREIYRTHFQPWIPILRPHFFTNVIEVHDDSCIPRHSLLHAIIAASGPFLREPMQYDHAQYLDAAQAGICEGLLKRTDMDTLHACVIVEFLSMGDGRLTEHWGLVCLLPQLVLKAGLHLEDQHLTPEQHEHRRLTGLHLDSKTWRSRETSRRLFWVIFLIDHFAALLSGSSPSFESGLIRRQLPCEGNAWLENREVHTREFIPADTAVQVQITSDPHIGALAYLIEATEILAMMNDFASRARLLASSAAMRGVRDMRGTFREFLNLDLIMANWKARLPAHFQHASPDQDGYIDHNITLAHLTHNTAGILLYQSLRGLWSTWEHVSNQSSALSYLVLVKQAAKEIAKISARFLLHRRYIVSPQFCLCQFIAGRALLAYSRWFEEALDQDFQTITTSLSESSKRWSSAQPSHHDHIDPTEESPAANDFAAQLLARLRRDATQPDFIDVTISWTKLWDEMQQGQATARKADTTQVLAQSTSAQTENSTAYSQQPNISNSRTITETSLDGPNMSQSDEVASLFLSSVQFETLDDRIFSWKDYENLATGQAVGQAVEAPLAFETEPQY
ncbi:unnamed protein product [Clonostachys rosea]|uniref:Zn(2)-C6 fungal-type domain-containing protein n=1 Tax=Bionectria ochroleuca TaxID=29856 RepID=A0ABY6UX33_BIOOC|nr:unnamed protein product [Clonostachys rosea]